MLAPLSMPDDERGLHFELDSKHRPVSHRPVVIVVMRLKMGIFHGMALWIADVGGACHICPLDFSVCVKHLAMLVAGLSEVAELLFPPPETPMQPMRVSCQFYTLPPSRNTNYVWQARLTRGLENIGLSWT